MIFRHLDPEIHSYVDLLQFKSFVIKFEILTDIQIIRSKIQSVTFENQRSWKFHLSIIFNNRKNHLCSTDYTLFQYQV